MESACNLSYLYPYRTLPLKQSQAYYRAKLYELFGDKGERPITVSFLARASSGDLIGRHLPDSRNWSPSRRAGGAAKPLAKRSVVPVVL